MTAPRVVKVLEAKTNLSALLHEVEAGAEVVIARGSEPVARLTPYRAPGRRDLGFVALTLSAAFFEDLPESEMQAWEG